MRDDLPRPIAFALARSRPLEPDREAAAPVRAWCEYAVLRLLSDDLRDLPSLPFVIESAMRVTMAQRMETDAWLELLAALQSTGRLAGLGPAALPEPVRAACDALGVEPDLLKLVKAAASGEVDLEEAITALVRGSRLDAEPLCAILDAEPTEGGCVAVMRVLTGTGWPAVVRRELSPCPAPVPGLFFVRQDGEAVSVPPWLATWDDREGRLWLFSGRDRSSGRWLYASWGPTRLVEERDQPGGPVPVFLAEPTWGTPAPTRRYTSETPRPAGDTERIDLRQLVQPPPSREAHAGDRTILRVINGRDLMRYTGIEPDQQVVVGRNPAFAGFVVHHHQVSRSHTRLRCTAEGRVFVQDLKSANGTQVNGRPVGTDAEVEVRRGDVVAVGPVLVRLEGVTAEQEARLAAIGRLREDERRRDPLTGLLVPKHLADELPPDVREHFSAGTGELGGTRLFGVLLYVDRLSAIHAQHGEQIANEIFHNVARLVQFAVDYPERCVRVGYGELLVPLLDLDRTAAWVVAERLLEVVHGHTWPASVQGLTLTGAVAPKLPSETAQAWLQRARTALQAGRSKHGRSRIYAADP